MGLCVAMIAFVRLPSLKVSCLLLSGLLIYDVFWVRYAPVQNFTPITSDARATAMRYSKQTVYSRTFKRNITPLSGFIENVLIQLRKAFIFVF